MGSRRSGVSPGQSKAITGAAVGPGSISGLPIRLANEVLSKADRLRGDVFTPETVRIASEFLGLPDRSGPPMKTFALPPSVRDKDLLTEQFIENIKKIDAPPSMTISQTPNTLPPGLEIIPNLPNTLPPGLEPKDVFPDTAPPGTPTTLPNLPGGGPPKISRGAIQKIPIAEGGIMGLARNRLQSLIIQDLIDRGLLYG